MLDHVSITVSDLAAAERFYDAIMKALDVVKVGRSDLWHERLPARSRREQDGSGLPSRGLKRFPAKWSPVRVKKTRQTRNLDPRSDSIGTERL